MRLLISLSILLWWVSVSFGQAFGRFGYTETPSLPGIVFDRSGFRAKFSGADRLSFGTPISTWKPVLTNETQQVVETEGKGPNPAKVKMNLLGAGISLYCPTELELKLTSLASPALTWTEGSVLNGVPTPNLKWCLLSFQDNQPAWIMSVPDGTAGWQISGKPGAWLLKSKGLKGWVRFGLPLGTKPRPTSTAASMGQLVQDVQPVLDHFALPVANLLRVRVVADMQSVTATWVFDQPLAVVPIAARFAEIGGYPIGIESPMAGSPIVTEEGACDFVKGTELRIRFPIRRIPAGRALVSGGTPAALGTVSPFDVPSVVEVAFENLLAYRDVQTLRTAEDCLTEFLGQVQFKAEPWTGQQLPYEKEGRALDLIAAQGFLCDVMTAVKRGGPEPNALLTSLQWRTDWSNWQLNSADPKVNRRAAAIAALSGAFSPLPEKRLAAAMLQAGLSAERGLQGWRHRQGLVAKEEPLLETLWDLRQAVFGLRMAKAGTASDWFNSILGPIRVYGEPAISCTVQDKKSILEWFCAEPKPGSWTLGCEHPVKLSKGDNLARLKIENSYGLLELQYVPDLSGPVKTLLEYPEWARKIPSAIPVQRFTERSQ